MIGRSAALPALLAAAVAAPAAGQGPRTIYVPASEYPAGVEPGDSAVPVEVRYALADDGRFAECEVRRSAGRPALDEASCRLLTERARFRPEPGRRRGRLVLRWSGRDAGGLNPAGAPIAVSVVDEIFDTDYPAEAFRRGESGRVTYDVEVSRTGVPLRCTVSESSGSAALDETTCRIVMERSAFIPASNGAGGSARGVYRGRITWRLEGG